MRIRLILGQHRSHNSGPRESFMQWCAGTVPIGTEGTVYLPELTRDEERRLTIKVPVLRDLCVEWDGIPAKEGWKFSLSREAGQPLELEYYEVVAYPA
jgi:hypothetical protein